MNLFYNPTLSELHALVDQVNEQAEDQNYKVVVDNDGEVIVGGVNLAEVHYRAPPDAGVSGAPAPGPPACAFRTPLPK